MPTPARENFSRTMLISCFSFTELAKRAAEMMPATGGAMITLTFGGSMRVMPNYNVMGVAKAALEASVRYLAADFGSRGIRVNAISAGPVRTLAGSGIGDARAMFAFQQKHSPLGRGVTLDELGGSALYLLSDLSGGVTGEIHYVDSGYNIISMPRPEELKNSASSAEHDSTSRTCSCPSLLSRSVRKTGAFANWLRRSASSRRDDARALERRPRRAARRCSGRMTAATAPS